jgi:hypothetical protein
MSLFQVDEGPLQSLGACRNTYSFQAFLQSERYVIDLLIDDIA